MEKCVAWRGSVSNKDNQIISVRVGFWSAILTAIMAALFFTIGILTPVRSITYPYINGIAAFVPGDYYWMYPAFLLAPAFVVLMTSINAYASESKKFFSQLGLAFAIIYAAIASTNYFVQFAVVEPSILKVETANLSLLSEYNPHGIFIALESLGYLMMTVAFLFAAPVFSGGRVQRAIRWLYTSGFVLAVGFLLGLSILGYDIVSFEVASITIDCTVLIASGVLLSRLFQRVSRSPPVLQQRRIPEASQSYTLPEQSSVTQCIRAGDMSLCG
jgi:hypothetical protein